LDRLTVQAEVNSDIYAAGEQGPSALAPLRQRIADELRRAVGVGVAVELKPAGEFERTQFKARRIIDLRKY
jgi:phenylacetate-coenzyme A ligase PaaK-like adenylate-forming protein